MLILFILFSSFSFSVFAVSCPVGSYEWQTNCLLFQNATIGFADAEAHCRDLGGHLASIHDGFTDVLLSQKANDHFHDSTVIDFWIGLSDLASLGNWTWTDGTSLGYKNWAPQEPKNISGTDCAALPLTNSKWISDDCFKLKPYVCMVSKSFYQPTTTTTAYPLYYNCTPPFTYFQPTHACYGSGYIYAQYLNWTTSENYCESNGGHLASIHSYEELRFLDAFASYANYGSWTGAFSNDNGKTWKWSDGSPFDYNPWTSGFPNRSSSGCGGLEFGLVDYDCTNTLRKLCKIPL